MSATTLSSFEALSSHPHPAAGDADDAAVLHTVPLGSGAHFSRSRVAGTREYGSRAPFGAFGTEPGRRLHQLVEGSPKVRTLDRWNAW
jgi:hypothetical protein